MSDNAALFGLLGAVGGAALGAGAVVIGPMLLHRQQSRDRKEEVSHAEQREHEQMQLEEAWRQREFQRETARERKSDREALARRLINVRASTRNYLGFLAKSYKKVAGGTEINIEEFENSVAVVQAELNSAFDDALLDGIWFAHAKEAIFLRRQARMLNALGGGEVPNTHRIDATALGSCLMTSTDLVTECVRCGPPTSDELRRRTEASLTELETARSELVAYIKGRLDAQSLE